MPKSETYYDILRVPRTASVSEIVSAYHSAKNAFSKDSIATYSLLSAEENEAVLAKLEEAYLTLSNIAKRKAYDRSLEAPEGTLESHSVPTFVEEPVTVPAAPAQDPNVPLNGAFLKKLREEKGLSIEDVSRVTKIPLRYLKAIENDDFAHFPARVYLQGFVKNLASLYKIDAKKAMVAYLEWLNQSYPVAS